MAFVVKDRVQETSTTTGTGTFTLAGATAGFSSFSVIGNANTTYYTITANADWEVGIGTYTSSGTTLSRDTVLASSNSNNLVDFPAGTKNVFVVYPAGRAVIVNGSTVEVPNSATLPVTAGGTGSSTATFSGANITSLNASSISTGTLANARTTASSSNGASTIVARDASGDFSARTITVTVSVNAPIFYDSGNTGFYVDPAPGTNGVSANFQGRIQLGTFNNSQSNSGEAWLGRAADRNAGTFTVQLGGGSSTSRSFEVVDYNWTTVLFSAGSNGVVTASADMRAPIFYDNNNTGYYLDPASTTSLRTVGDWRSDSSTWSGEFSGKIQYHANNWYIQAAGELIYRTSGGNNVFTVNQSGVASASGDMRAPIFYDSNNTGYYVDPNSVSQLHYVLADNWFRPQGGTGVYWQSYGRGIRAADNEFSYGNIGTYGDGLNGWRGYGIFPNNAILMSNGSTTGIYNPSGGLWQMQMDNSGNTTFNGNVTAYSDLRLKNNVREIDNVIERRNTLAISAIKYERDGRTRIGYGAQTLRDNGCNEFVHESDDALKLATGLGTLSVDYGETTAILAVASKLTDDRLTALEAQVQQLLEIINERRNS